MVQAYSGGADSSYTLVESLRRFGSERKPVSQLQVLEDWGVLLARADSKVKVHRLCQGFPQLDALEKTNHCSHYSVVLQGGGEGQLVAAVKKRLFLYRWSSGSFQHVRDFRLPEAPRVMQCEF